MVHKKQSRILVTTDVNKLANTKRTVESYPRQSAIGAKRSPAKPAEKSSGTQNNLLYLSQSLNNSFADVAFLDSIGSSNLPNAMAGENPRHHLGALIKMQQQYSGGKRRLRRKNYPLVLGTSISPTPKQPGNSSMHITKDSFMQQQSSRVSTSSIKRAQPSPTNSPARNIEVSQLVKPPVASRVENPPGSGINLVLCAQGPLYLKPGIINQTNQRQIVTVIQSSETSLEHETNSSNSSTLQTTGNNFNPGKEQLLPFQQRLFLNQFVKKSKLVRQRPSLLANPNEIYGSPILLSKNALGIRRSTH